jgi:hypothetical protein
MKTTADGKTSIWMPGGKIASTGSIVGWNTGIATFENKTIVTTTTPEEGKKNEEDADDESTTKADAISKATQANPEAIIDATKETNDQAAIDAKATGWKATYDSYYKKQIGKEMPLDFYKKRAECYGTDGNYRLDFIYDNTPYRRQGGDLPPTRHIEKAKKSWLQGKLK